MSGNGRLPEHPDDLLRRVAFPGRLIPPFDPNTESGSNSGVILLIWNGKIRPCERVDFRISRSHSGTTFALSSRLLCVMVLPGLSERSEERTGPGHGSARSNSPQLVTSSATCHEKALPRSVHRCTSSHYDIVAGLEEGCSSDREASVPKVDPLNTATTKNHFKYLG